MSDGRKLIIVAGSRGICLIGPPTAWQRLVATAIRGGLDPALAGRFNGKLPIRLNDWEAETLGVSLELGGGFAWVAEELAKGECVLDVVPGIHEMTAEFIRGRCAELRERTEEASAA